jgi:hypothetical protein
MRIAPEVPRSCEKIEVGTRFGASTTRNPIRTRSTGPLPDQVHAAEHNVFNTPMSKGRRSFPIRRDAAHRRTLSLPRFSLSDFNFY